MDVYKRPLVQNHCSRIIPIFHPFSYCPVCVRIIAEPNCDTNKSFKKKEQKSTGMKAVLHFDAGCLLESQWDLV